jgi:hypothetical protein
VIELRKLTASGISVFKTWLESGGSGTVPSILVSGPENTETVYGIQIDPDKIFENRYDFGCYLNEVFKDIDFTELMSRENDGLWAWLAVIYFGQLAPLKPAKFWNYIVTHVGPKGSLAYRQAARTSYELVKIHGEEANVCLAVKMSTWGEMAEQLTSRRTLVYNRGFFSAASTLYVRKGKLKRGASSKPVKLKNRKPGVITGFGSARRLAIALQRLDLTYDTEIMGSTELIIVLPKEFAKWVSGKHKKLKKVMSHA